MENLFFSGDTFLNYTGEVGFDNKRFKSIFTKADAICVNLETVIGGGEKVQKAFNISTDEKRLEQFTKVFSDVRLIANIANNHMMDYGEAGYRSTISSLDNHNILIAGERNKTTKIISMGGRNVGIVGFTYNECQELGYIGENIILNSVNSLRDKGADCIIVCLHWGEEYVPYPSPYQRELCHTLVDNGVDVIIGHHPHVMLGYEYYKKGAIFYSLGNFNFGVVHPYHQKLKETKYGYCVKLQISEDKLQTEIVPVRINNDYIPELLEGEEKKSIINYIEHGLNSPLEIGYSRSWWRSMAAKYHFRNNMPAWWLRIKKYGFKQFILMTKWIVNKDQIKYFLAWCMAPFLHKQGLNANIHIEDYLDKR